MKNRTARILTRAINTAALALHKIRKHHPVVMSPEQEKYHKLLSQAQAAWAQQRWAQAVSLWSATIKAYDALPVEPSPQVDAWKQEMRTNLAHCRLKHPREALTPEQKARLSVQMEALRAAEAAKKAKA